MTETKIVPVEPSAEMTEAAAKAAWLDYARGDDQPQDWWTLDDWSEWRAPERQWEEAPDLCTHIGADGFRECARAALTAAITAAPALDGWNRDMEAAPRKGNVLLWIEGWSEPIIGRWDTTYSTTGEPWSGWVAHGRTPIPGCAVAWMALPAGPAEGEVMIDRPICDRR